MLGQAHAPWRRLLGTSLAAFGVLALPAPSGADPSRSAASLRAENSTLVARSRSAALSLYALDSRLAAARTRLAALQLQAGKLRAERRTLVSELRVARVGARVSQERLASRLRVLFDHGDTSALEVIFGARSIDEALVELDNLNRFASINADVLIELRSAKARIGRTSHALAAREASLAEATRAQAATTRALSAARSERVAYVADLGQRLALNEAQIGSIEAQVRSARQHTEQLTVARTTTKSAPATAAALVTPLRRGRTMTVDAVAYSLPGSTASGLPVGPGVVAVDPSVIPLGTHMYVPGYGDAVAADTGSAVIGGIIDLWFPTLAQAQAWGRRSLTITLD